MRADDQELDVHIPINTINLEGILTVPPGAKGIVIFAHGSGSSRLSPRNTYVARVLQHEGLATLLFDLLREEEDVDYENRFDINLLTDRLLAGTQWVMKDSRTRSLPIGYFGASTGAAAALQAAAKLGEPIKAIVSRGGRPDLAEAALDRVTAPTLLIVGGNDEVVIDLNREADRQLSSEKELSIVPGATHLFEEPGALEQVAREAADWFNKHLTKDRQ